MDGLRGDFLGFTFDGIHSSELGIFRVSDGSRYTENLLPTIQDKTAQVPGGDGTYYFNSYYTKKDISFPISFGELTEEQLRRIKVLFSDKKIHDLIFDEIPYKIYKVKVSGTPNLKYVCFDNLDFSDRRDGDPDAPIRGKEDLYGIGLSPLRGRIYKGEGQLSFVSYSPFAKSRYKFIDQYTVDTVPEWGSFETPTANDVYYNLYDWAESTRFIRSDAVYNYKWHWENKVGDEVKSSGDSEVECIVDTPFSLGCAVYNAGDLATPFKLKLWFNDEEKETSGFKNHFDGMTIKYHDKMMDISEFNLYYKGGSTLDDRIYDAGIQINTKTCIIEGIDGAGNLTGHIYSQYLKQGDFFRIEPTTEIEFMEFEWKGNDRTPKMEIEYDYLYL